MVTCKAHDKFLTVFSTSIQMTFRRLDVTFRRALSVHTTVLWFWIYSHHSLLSYILLQERYAMVYFKLRFFSSSPSLLTTFLYFLVSESFHDVSHVTSDKEGEKTDSEVRTRKRQIVIRRSHFVWFMFELSMKFWSLRWIILLLWEKISVREDGFSYHFGTLVNKVRQLICWNYYNLLG